MSAISIKLVMSLIHKEAARILKLVDQQKGSVKNLIHSSDCQKKKPLFALVCETLKNREIIDEISQKTNIRKYEKCLSDIYLCRIILYDYLFGRGLAKGKFKDAVLKHKTALKSELARIKVKKNVSSNKELLNSGDKNTNLPKYIRVNTLKSNCEEVVKHFQRDGYKYIFQQSDNYENFVKSVKSLKKKEFTKDVFVDDLLIFPGSIDLHDHVLYESGHIIFQDKASCIPSFVLSPPTGSHVVDCCAAPGNKTSHLAALMNDKGIIYAFDKDMKRFSTMNTQLLKAGISCVKPKLGDFLHEDPSDKKYANVKYILCDPSCSGSGIVSRMDDLTNDERSESKERLEKLAAFQKKILLKALSFPKAEKVVYSTCSVHEIENEGVVREVLKEVKDKYELQNIDISRPDASGFIRLSPKTDVTNGFFVSCFKRKK